MSIKHNKIGNRIIIINNYVTTTNCYIDQEIPQNKLDAYIKKYPKKELLLNHHFISKNSLVNNFLMYLPYIKKGNYIELGCGSGMLVNFIYTFSSNKIVPYGIDLDQEILLLAKKNNPKYPENFIKDNFYQTLKNKKFDFKKFSTINLFVSLKDNGSIISKLVAPIVKNNLQTSFIFTDLDYDFFDIKDKEVIEFIDAMSRLSTVSVACHNILIVGNNANMHNVARSTALRLINYEGGNRNFDRREIMNVSQSKYYLKRALSSLNDKTKISQYKELLQKISTLPLGISINGVVLNLTINGVKIVDDEKEYVDITFDKQCLFTREYAKDNKPVFEEIVSSNEILEKNYSLIFFMKKNEKNVAILVKQILFI